MSSVKTILTHWCSNLNLASQHSVCLKAEPHSVKDKVYLVYQEVYLYNNIHFIIIIIIIILIKK
jgi:hypothetical protein